ncbi:MAG: hypothetical protein KC609_11910 [Myxococcales bacterium]|nr:hypothetical protein [Myxococcales bacterium]
MTSDDIERIRSALERVVLRVTADQDLGMKTTPMIRAYGFAVRIRLGGKVLIVTSLPLVVKASSIRITTGDNRVFNASIEFRDPQQALAVLSVANPKDAKALASRAGIATLAADGSMKPQTFLYSLVHIPGHGTQVAKGTLLSTQKGPLYGYWGNDIPVVYGLPLFHFDGTLLGINFRYGFSSNKFGLCAGVERLREFLKAYAAFDEKRRRKSSR